MSQSLWTLQVAPEILKIGDGGRATLQDQVWTVALLVAAKDIKSVGVGQNHDKNHLHKCMHVITNR